MRQDFLNTRSQRPPRPADYSSNLHPKRPELPSPLPSSHPTIHVSFAPRLKSPTMYPTRIMRMQPSRPFAFPTPKEGQSAHTVSQRLRMLKKVPPELIPLGLVLGVAIGAAMYASGHKLLSDKTLRLSRNSPESREH
ncbi:hypothetical protein FE257_003173 [Aspergillus nanangensis]|uniref:Uncharacterized protein n=1 Tax=Aspergillus nanangensis TaxID=2582783 RepID=A0AAD4GMY0_ASPNN|nr:hypothetical protein FE257_003173 [Aspergillus nanangensis]